MAFVQSLQGIVTSLASRDFSQINQQVKDTMHTLLTLITDYMRLRANALPQKGDNMSEILLWTLAIGIIGLGLAIAILTYLDI